ncbi:hypothetical protein ANO11243_090000 [Dothideomycetidae sp. 11243]|nr:hypothetical protein ANO11243_090000 [fungal sp. No.11243]
MLGVGVVGQTTVIGSHVHRDRSIRGRARTYDGFLVFGYQAEGGAPYHSSTVPGGKGLRDPTCPIDGVVGGSRLAGICQDKFRVDHKNIIACTAVNIMMYTAFARVREEKK